MQTEFQRRGGWRRKFGCAFRGIVCGIRSENSFIVHFVVAGAVVLVAALMQVSLLAWCILLLCIAVVFVAELFNTALEYLARAITRQYDPDLGSALDIGSGAVLLAAAGACLIGGIVFVHRLGELLAWWP